MPKKNMDKQTVGTSSHEAYVSQDDCKFSVQQIVRAHLQNSN